MEGALRELKVGSWFAGLRRIQSPSRATLPYVNAQGPVGQERWKVHRLCRLDRSRVFRYLKQNDCLHPLWSRAISRGRRAHTKPSTAREERRRKTLLG